MFRSRITDTLGEHMQTWFFRLVAISALVMTSTTAALAQKAEFSADMHLLDASGQSDTVKLYVGAQRARLDRTGGPGDTKGISALIIDFYHQIIYLLVPQAKVYMRIAGSDGVPFYQAAWIFRPPSSDQPCGQWVSEADRRGITLTCQRVGEDTVSGRTTEKWEATSPEGAHGYLWYDKDLNFVTRVSRTSKSGVQSGYELKDIKQGTQPKELFDP
jgi:hypothetical protein